MMDIIVQWDETLFQLINGAWKNRFFDIFLPWWRNQYVWAPLYVFFVSFLCLNFPKKGWIFALTLLATVAVSDQISSNLIKKTVKRQRPCNNIVFKKKVILRVECGSGYSFTSSHASNHFAVATFIAFTLGRKWHWIAPVLLFWAATIAYGQVYVGVHYPLDILVGGLLGCLIGWLGAKLSRFIFEEKNAV